MELKFKTEFMLESIVQRYQIVLDTIALTEGEDNFTTSGIRVAAMIALLSNACEEDIVELYNEASDKVYQFCAEVIEPHVLKLLNNNTEYLDDIVQEVVEYKQREIEMSGKIIYAIKKALAELSEMDTKSLADIILSITSLKNTAVQEAALVQEEQKQEQIEAVDDKLQQLINKFTRESAN
jgi:phage/plasmid-associated DNA primase